VLSDVSDVLSGEDDFEREVDALDDLDDDYF
jgi:hypothetical protein